MSQNSILKYNMITVHPDRINIVHITEVKGSSRRQIDHSTDNEEVYSARPKKEIKFTIEDKLSDVTQRKLKRAIKYIDLVTKNKIAMTKEGKHFCNFKMSFVTLTLSSTQVHSDNEIKSKLINQFLVEAKTKWKVEYHIWRLEKQKNGNCHFHFIFDKFIPHAELREVWNRIQNKLGYVDRYQEKMKAVSFNEYKELFDGNPKYTLEMIKNAWKKGKSTNWKYPNSTDVHSLMFINNIDAYLIKYMSKDEQNKGIEGRLWGCSQNLSNIQGARDIENSDLLTEINYLFEKRSVRKVTDVYYTIYFVEFKSLLKEGCFALYNMFRDYMLESFSIDIASAS